MLNTSPDREMNLQDSSEENSGSKGSSSIEMIIEDSKIASNGTFMANHNPGGSIKRIISWQKPFISQAL